VAIMLGQATTPYLVGFDEIPDAERALVGGKARHLAKMTAESFPVPRAAVLVTDAYREFVSQPIVAKALAGLRDEAALHPLSEPLERRFDELAALFAAQPLPAGVAGALEAFWSTLGERRMLAVRSSGTLEDSPEASFSGMLVSVVGVGTLEELEAAVKRCWVSASRPRVLGYARSVGRDPAELDVAVIVQHMVPAERAGLVFTRDPANRYAHGVIVEATHGTGEDVVSGEVTPERYVYHPGDERVTLVRSGAQRGAPPGSVPESDRHLSDSEVARLARWGLRAEELFGAPQDLEWAFGLGQFWLLQSRPLVFASREERVFFPQVAEETVLLHGVGASPQVGSGEVIVAVDDVPQDASGAVVVLERLTNDLAVRLRDAAGVIADEGGATSHGANLLREFGVPAVISTGHATERLCNGMSVTVDGFRGNVYEGDLSIGEQAFEGVPSTRMRVFASVLVPEKARAIAAYADGVSSLRDDYFLLASGIHPLEMIRRGHARELEDTIFQGICETCEIFEGKPVWYKTMDAPTDEFRRLAGGEQEPHERNPLLGWRGIGREIREPEMLGVELRAVARAVAEGHETLGIKLPFVRFISEFEETLDAAEALGLRPGDNIQVGISVETPATALGLAPFLDAGAAFVSVGVSDLTMCTLALDRESHRVAEGFCPAHPVVVHLLERISETARSSGVFACATGESAHDEDLLPHLVRMDYDAIGVSCAYFADVKRRIHVLEEDGRAPEPSPCAEIHPSL
jgi:pyruvate,water dikinase